MLDRLSSQTLGTPTWMSGQALNWTRLARSRAASTSLWSMQAGSTAQNSRRRCSKRRTTPTLSKMWGPDTLTSNPTSDAKCVSKWIAFALFTILNAVSNWQRRQALRYNEIKNSPSTASVLLFLCISQSRDSLPERDRMLHELGQKSEAEG